MKMNCMYQSVINHRSTETSCARAAEQIHWEKELSGYTENPVALTGRSISAFTTLG